MPLYYDTTFKALFGNPRYITLLQSILSASLNIPLEDLQENISFENVELSKFNIHEQTKRVDLIIRIADKIINIELNVSKKNSIIKRNFAYISSVYSRDFQTELDKSKKQNKNWDKKNNQNTNYLQINFNCFSIGEKKVKKIYHVQTDEGTKLIDNLIIVEINIDHCHDVWYNENKQGVKPQDWALICWGSILRSKTKEEIEEILKEKEMKDVRKKLLEAIDTIQNDSTVTNEFNREKAYWYDLECSKEEGIQEGRIEEKYITAKNLLKENVDINIIQRVTNLSSKQLSEIQLQL